MIKAISFAASYLVIRLFSFLPFFILDLIGWAFYQLLDKIVHYRKKIILKNLYNAFPEKSEEEIKKIASGFYRYFARLIIENVKMIHFSPKRLARYISFENPDELHRHYANNRSVAAIAAHYGNWEWLQGVRSEIPHIAIGIYKQFSNKYFDVFFNRHRSKFKTQMVNMREAPRELANYYRKHQKTLTLFVADQSPVWEEIQYWTRFLNQDTPVYLGPEKLARRLRLAVVYWRVKVEKRHRYKVEIITITNDASELKDYELTEKHLKLLEEDIRNQPQYWLWSHRRWKLTEKRMNEERKGNIRFEGKFKKK